LIDYSYIPISYEKNVKTFKYSGNDKSLLYKYLLSPLAEKLLIFVPKTMAYF